MYRLSFPTLFPTLFHSHFGALDLCLEAHPIGHLLPFVAVMSKKEYAVEKIVDHSYDVEANDIMYLVKWKGFDSSENTWESSKTLHKCKESIKCYWQIKSVNKISVVADLYNLSFPNPEKRSTTIIINPSEAMVLIDGFCYRQAYKSGNTYLYVKVIDKFIPANKITYGDMGFEPSLCTSDHILGTSSVCQIIGPSLKFLSVDPS